MHQRFCDSDWIRFPCGLQCDGRSGRTLTGAEPAIELSAVADMRSSPVRASSSSSSFLPLPGGGASVSSSRQKHQAALASVGTNLFNPGVQPVYPFTKKHGTSETVTDATTGAPAATSNTPLIPNLKIQIRSFRSDLTVRISR